MPRPRARHPNALRHPSTPLSKTEWKIMNHCWRLGQSTARQIYEASLEQEKREYRTVKTLLDRIAAKGYLAVEKLGPLCLFRPQVSQSAALRSAIQDFVEVVLDNSLAPLFVHLSDREQLSEKEMAALRALIEEAEEEKEA